MALSMYRCQRCRSVISSGVKMHRVVMETRPKLYPQLDKNNKPYPLTDTRYPPYPGREIVREISVCPDCVTQMRVATQATN